MESSRAGRDPGAILAGARLRCPACRTGRIFRPLSFHMHDRCPRCGVAFERARGEFTGALMFFMGFVGFMALMGWFVLTVLTTTPAWVGWAWLVAWGLLVPVFLYRNAKGVWVGLVHYGAGLEPPSAPARPSARSSGADDPQS